MGERLSPRIAPGTRSQVGLLNAGIIRIAGMASGGRPPNIFTTLGRHRSLFRRWLWFAAALMPGGRLPRDETELVILRVACNAGSEYEWGHHERIGRRAGLSEEEIARVRGGPDAPGWSERRALLLRAVDQMHSAGELGDEVWSPLAAELGDELMIELCMLIGHYEMLAMTLNSIRVAPDPAPSRSRP
jgi:alkylhydroperoxidase family enzyme